MSSAPVDEDRGSGLARLVKLLLPASVAGPLLRDLAEGYRLRVEREGASAARRWRRRQLLRTLRPDRVATLRRMASGRRVESGPAGPFTRIGRGVVALLTDLRHALRLLWRRPGFTALTVLVLAGGLAVSIFTFSFMHTVLHRELPLPDGDSVVRLMAVEDGRSRLLDAFDFERMRDGLVSFDVVGSYDTRHVLVEGSEESRAIYATFIEPNMHEVAPIPPMLGRGLLPSDAEPGAEPVVLLGEAVWRAVFGADPGVVGEPVNLNGVRTRIVGVMPDSFGFPVFGQLWMPLSRPRPGELDRGDSYRDVYARIRPGVAHERADAELATALERLRSADPDPDAEYPDRAIVRTFQKAQLGDEADLVFFTLHLAAGFILLLCCVNAANLLLARGLERTREIRVRLALGAPRFRLMAQMMAEGMVLALLAGGVGLFVAARALAIFDARARSALEFGLAYWWRWGLDGATVAAAAVLVAATMLLVGGLPAWNVTRRDGANALRDDERPGRSAAPTRLSRAVVVMQIAVIAVLLFLGGVTSMVARRAGDVDLGLTTERVMFGNVTLPEERYADAESRIGFLRRLEEELRGRSAVEGVVFRSSMGSGTAFEIEGRRYETEEQRPEAQVHVSMGQQAAIGVDLLAGRRFDAREAAGSEPVAIVSESLGRTFWGEGSPLGQRIRLETEVGATDPPWREVIGVVSDILEGNPIGRNRSHETIYVPMTQIVPSRVAVTLRHRGDVRAAMTALHDALAAVDPRVRPDRVEDFDAMLETMRGRLPSRRAVGLSPREAIWRE